MTTAGLLVTAASSLAASAAFALVAITLARRPYRTHVRLVGLAFSGWWVLFSLGALTDALRVLLATTGHVDVPLYLALARLKIVLVAGAIWALGYYAVYLWTGRDKAAGAIAAFAFSHGLLFLYLFERRGPVEVAVGAWAPRLVFTEASSLPPLLGLAALVFFFLPPMVFAVSYLLLAPRLPTRSQRYRAVAVAGVILLFHAVGILQFRPETSADTPAFAVFSLLNALAALTAYFAYHPPALLRRRLGLKSLAEEAERSFREGVVFERVGRSAG